ncbi:hypothetical protein DMH02_011485 [Streptomyces sp. WAC 00631]|uniref:hypothetical protein n=1 Tax=Streptomyces sp. WAC 00631 TaxID=2203201 RepID=UPI00163C866A|nr:hypothetical protein [Streptomyces sp. WAC 00631]MCC5033830.1 hypothetical protein [Streptomyces sp. WAC 00631]
MALVGGVLALLVLLVHGCGFGVLTVAAAVIAVAGLLAGFGPCPGPGLRALCGGSLPGIAGAAGFAGVAREHRQEEDGKGDQQAEQ